MKTIGMGIASTLVVKGLLCLALLIGALASASGASAPGAPSGSSAGQSELLSVAGNPSVVRISRFTLLSAPLEPTCAVFDIRFRNPLVVAEISTFGLGRTLLAAWRIRGSAVDPLPMSSSSISCDVTTAWQPRLRLQMLEPGDRIDWRVAMKLDTGSLSADGTAIEGQILVSTDGKSAVTIPIKIERLPMSPLLTALAWFVGIVVPAGLTFWLARFSEARIDRKKREAERTEIERKQQEEFLAWRQLATSVDLMEEFFNQQLPAAHDLPNPCATLFAWMHSHSMLEKVPPAEYELLVEVCQVDDRQGFLNQLRKLFPERRAEVPAQWN
jgi:hypothetical protein